MKKIYFLAFMGIAATAFAQTGKVGINATSPAATLEIQPTTANADPNATTNEGILIPRLTAARVARIAAPVEGTMVYVTDAPASSKFSDTTKGFYYWDAAAAKWTKMGSGSAGVTNNIYTANGTLTNAREVTQNNNNLTFTTGTGRTIINGTTQLNGALYLKSVKRVTVNGIYTTTSDDYFVAIDGAVNGITLPAAESGRQVCYFVTDTNLGGINVTPTPVGSVTYVAGGVSNCFISDGTNWFSSVGG